RGPDDAGSFGGRCARGSRAGADVGGGGGRQARAPSRVEADARLVRSPVGGVAVRGGRGSRRRAVYRGDGARGARVVGGTPVDRRAGGVLRGDRGGTRSRGAASRVRVLRWLGDPGLSVAAPPPPPP